MPTQIHKGKKPNRLINEKSPYLLQHAYNPVDWYPWTKEAFEKAVAENKPIFLSIGYSTCHWCHVMEEECFSDPEVAKLLNEAFVCIKVDREERPDIDATYMAVCQAMGRNCGWPLNVLMTPKMNPFFAASYIPKNSDRGLTGMMDLVPQVMQIWKLRRAELEIVGADIKGRLELMETRTSEGELGEEILQDAFEVLKREFDQANGGFGRAPKFPRPHSLLFLLRYWKRSGTQEALDMVEKTLRRMRLGGIFDQLGFGFHRYSTDAQWLVPHFEKMLYDQAMLAMAYTETFQATGANKFKITARETLEYALGELASSDGGFFSAEDADSEGEEGKFYLWAIEEVIDALPPEDADLAVHLFGLSGEGNYFEPSTGGKDGKNILHLPTPLESLAAYKGLTINELLSRMEKIREALLEVRKNRVPPAKDDKILTDWNGLMIAALSKAGRVFDEQKFVNAAVQTADFLLSHMLNEEGTLYHRYAKGERAIEGFLDDYTFLAYGLIELYMTTFEEKYLRIATDLTRTTLKKFWDEKTGGFFLTVAKSENAMPRMKQVYDGALPSGNSVGLLNLLRLSILAADSSLEDFAVKQTRTFSEEVKGNPQAYTFLLAGVDFMVGPSQSVVLVEGQDESNTQEMVKSIRSLYLPNLVVSIWDPRKASLGYENIEGKATAYVCHGKKCLPPTNSVERVLSLFENS